MFLLTVLVDQIRLAHPRKSKCKAHAREKDSILSLSRTRVPITAKECRRITVVNSMAAHRPVAPRAAGHVDYDGNSVSERAIYSSQWSRMEKQKKIRFICFRWFENRRSSRVCSVFGKAAWKWDEVDWTTLFFSSYIGLILLVNGVCNAAGSYLFGALAKYIGRLGCLIIAASMNCAMISLMFFWEPDGDQMFVLFIIAGVWGLSAAIWQSQVIGTFELWIWIVSHSYLSSVHSHFYRLLRAWGSDCYCQISSVESHRFSSELQRKAIWNIHAWVRFLCLLFQYASYISIYLTMIILFTFLTFSMICYIIAEMKMRWRSKMKLSERVITWIFFSLLQ